MSHSSGQRWPEVDALSPGDGVTLAMADGRIVTGEAVATEDGLTVGDVLVRQLNGWVGLGIFSVRRAILTPGIYDDISHEDYHSDPVPGGSLSSTGLKLLTPPSCPAKYRWQTDHPAQREVTEALEIGQAYHTLALGEGPTIIEVKADSWRGRDAQEARDYARQTGRTPILTGKLAAVREMVKVLRADPIAASALRSGKAEQSFFWQDFHEIWGRGRVDWLPTRAKGNRLIVPDLKSAASANPEDFGREPARKYGYAQSADWYLRGLRALGYADRRSVMIFLVQEKDPPYLVQPIQLDSESMRVGELLNDRALETYDRCLQSGTWPGYHEGVALASLPGWYITQTLESE